MVVDGNVWNGGGKYADGKGFNTFTETFLSWYYNSG